MHITNYGDISSDMESFNLNDFAMVGGICGLSEYGIIYNTVNKGTITSNGFGVGGIAGGVGINTELQDDTYYGRVYNSYNTGNISGKSYVGGINGVILTVGLKTV